MINWDDFEHIHVIRKLKEVIAKWWAIDVYFADDRGNLKIIEKGVKRDFSNPVLNLLMQREKKFIRRWSRRKLLTHRWRRCWQELILT